VARSKGCVACIVSARAAAGKLLQSKSKHVQVQHILLKGLVAQVWEVC